MAKMKEQHRLLDYLSKRENELENENRKMHKLFYGVATITGVSMAVAVIGLFI
jgi:cell division protein FtsB